MKRAIRALVLALLLVGFHATLRAFGLAAHVSAIAGMPVDAWSLPIAALYVVAYLAAVILAPVIALASVVEIVAQTDLRRNAGA